MFSRLPISDFILANTRHYYNNNNFRYKIPFRIFAQIKNGTHPGELTLAKFNFPTFYFSVGSKQVVSWMDAPDDVFYKATAKTKKLRKKMTVQALRKAARKPFKRELQLPA